MTVWGLLPIPPRTACRRHDLVLVTTLALVGGTLGACGDGDGHLPPGRRGLRQGGRDRSHPVGGRVGARMTFAIWVTHGGQASVARFSAAHHITSGAAWTAAFVLMALAEVLSRTGVLYLKTRRIGAVIPRGASVAARQWPEASSSETTRPAEEERDHGGHGAARRTPVGLGQPVGPDVHRGPVGRPRRSAVGRRPPGSAWRFRAAWVPLLAATASLGWIGSMACRRFEAPSAATWGCLAVLAVSGGALSGYAPFSVTFVAVGALGAGIAFDAAPAAAVGALGVAAVAVSVFALGTASPGEIIAEAHLRQSQGSWREQAVVNTWRGLIRPSNSSPSVCVPTPNGTRRLRSRNATASAVSSMMSWPISSAPSPFNSVRPTQSCSRETTRNVAREPVRQARSLAVRGLEETRQAETSCETSRSN